MLEFNKAHEKEKIGLGINEENGDNETSFSKSNSPVGSPRTNHSNNNRKNDKSFSILPNETQKRKKKYTEDSIENIDKNNMDRRKSSIMSLSNLDLSAQRKGKKHSILPVPVATNFSKKRLSAVDSFTLSSIKNSINSFKNIEEEIPEEEKTPKKIENNTKKEKSAGIRQSKTQIIPPKKNSMTLSPDLKTKLSPSLRETKRTIRKSFSEMKKIVMTDQNQTKLYLDQSPIIEVKNEDIAENVNDNKINSDDRKTEEFPQKSNESQISIKHSPKNQIKDLKLISKFRSHRLANRLHSMFDFSRQNLRKTSDPLHLNELDLDLKSENEFLLESLRKKNAVQIFSNHIFPKNKSYQKKIEFILNCFIANKRSSDYFDYIHSFFSHKNLPIITSTKFAQTNENGSSISKFTQTEFDRDEKKKQDATKKLMQTINVYEKIKVNGLELDQNTTTSTIVESKTNRLNNQDKGKFLTSSEKHVNNKRMMPLSPTNLNSSQSIKNSIYKQQDHLNSGFRKQNSEKSLNLNQNTILINNEKLETGKNNKELMKEFKTEEESLELEDEPKVEEKITQDVYEHIKRLSKSDESNYSKLKFLFKYPFRSINSKFDQKKLIFEEEEFKQKNEENDNMKELTYEKFHKFFKRMLKVHKKCGVNCIHLRRFFQKIGFKMNFPPISKELIISKTIINKLPKIF